MELGLSLGEASRSLSFFNKASKSNKGLGFCMDLDFGLSGGEVEDTSQRGNKVSANAPIQLELLPGSQYRCLPWTNEDGINEQGCSRGFDVNRLPLTEAMEGGSDSSPNRTSSSLHLDFSIYRETKTDDNDGTANETEPERASSRTSDDEENGLNRKKLRLSKEQSAFLEESFKEHHTLNPRQKLELAKQLNLRPRQVEVWFQNRRARTKLKQTEVDCEYLKRCCETLTEENKRLQKELQDLRVLKTSHPFYMQLPATTLTMCPSCERIATTNAPASGDSSAKTGGFTGLSKPVFFPFTPAHQSTSS